MLGRINMRSATGIICRGLGVLAITIACSSGTTFHGAGVSPDDQIIGASGPAPGPHTRAERTNCRETSTYADVIAFLDSLHGRPELSFGTIGKTTQGRDIPYVIASRPRVSTPQEARAL